MLSAVGIFDSGLYDSGVAQVAPLWFEQLGESNATGGMSVDDASGSLSTLDWKGEQLDVFTNEWIIQLTTDTSGSIGSLSEVAGLFNTKYGSIEVIGGLGLTGQVLIRCDEMSVAEAGEMLDASTSIAFYEPNAVLPGASATPDDPRYWTEWGLHNTGQTGGTPDADIDAPEAWDISTGSSSLVVGVIDTGVDWTHPDLAANMWTNPGEIAGNGIDDDGNGFVDDVHGYDFVNNDGNPMDDHYHGTHVAGTIAAAGNNGTGVTGVSWNTQIMALKFLSASGSGSTYDAVRAVNYATMMKTQYGVNVRVTNNSWGGGGYSQSLNDAIVASGQADMLFIAAAGNNGTNNDSSPHYPSNYNLDNVISVAATDYNDQLASFSNYGVNTVDLAAPGVSIYSTKPGNSYGSLSGTSMATPHVAGVAALAWSVAPDASAAEIRAAILDGVDNLASLDGKVTTGGRLNAYNALQQLGLTIVGSTPDAGAVVDTAGTTFTVQFSQVVDQQTVQASDFTVNGIGANDVEWVSGNQYRFIFDSSPVSTEGAQTMAIAEGAIGQSGSAVTNAAWQAEFYFDATPLEVVASTPDAGAELTDRPTAITLHLSEAYDPGSLDVSDLVLSAGTVTGVTAVDADTIRFDVDLTGVEGTVTYTLVAGALTDQYGTPNEAVVRSFHCDDPAVFVVATSHVPLTLIDGGTIEVTNYVAESRPIVDLDVSLTINHTWDSDLDVYLVAPDGTTVELFTDVGGSGDGFNSTILDDEASTSIVAGTAPFTGRFRPEGSLSAFDGMDTQGWWKLIIGDDYYMDGGSLQEWSLIFTVNAAPQVEAVADVALHAGETVTIDAAISDPEGDAFSTRVEVASELYDLDQQFALKKASGGYYHNYRGLNEKYIYSDSGHWYVIMPDGELLEWHGSFGESNRVAQLSSRVWQNPTLLHNAQPPASVPVSLSYDPDIGRLTIDSSDDYVGSFTVALRADDGQTVVTRYFQVTVANSAPEIAAIGNLSLSHSVDSTSLQLSYSDADGDALTATAEVISELRMLDESLHLGKHSRGYYTNYRGLNEKYLISESGQWYFILQDGSLYRWGGSIGSSVQIDTVSADVWVNPELLHAAPDAATASDLYAVDQSLGLRMHSSGYYTNYRGLNEKYLTVGNGRWYYVLPSGEMYRWGGSIAASYQVDTFSPEVWQHIGLLHNAQASASVPVSLTLDSDTQQLTIDPADGYTGSFYVSVEVSDGIATTSRAFSVDVTNQKPVLAAIDDLTIADAGQPATVQLDYDDPDGDTVSVEAQASSQLEALDRQLDLRMSSGGYYQNYRGHNEKYLYSPSSRAWYFILPNGEFYHWRGSIGASQQLATLDSEVWANPSLLHEAASVESLPVTLSVDTATKELSIDANGYVGTFQVSVQVSDGVESSTRQFNVTVGEQTSAATTLTADDTSDWKAAETSNLGNARHAATPSLAGSLDRAALSLQRQLQAATVDEAFRANLQSTPNLADEVRWGPSADELAGQLRSEATGLRDLLAPSEAQQAGITGGFADSSGVSPTSAQRAAASGVMAEPRTANDVALREVTLGDEADGYLLGDEGGHTLQEASLAEDLAELLTLAGSLLR